MTDDRRGRADLLLPVVGAALLAALAPGVRSPHTLPDLEARLRLEPGNVQLHAQAADLALQARDAERAIAHLQAFVYRRPGDAPAAFQLAQLYIQTNHPDAADLCLLPASRANWRLHNAALHLHFADLYAQLQDFNHADLEFDTGTAEDSANADAYCRYAMMLLDASNPDKAAKIMQKALDLQPDNALYHVQLARALRDSGLLDAATTEFNVALQKDPNCVAAYLEMARTSQRLNTEQGDVYAENFLRKGVEAAPDDPQPKVALAALLLFPRDPAKREANAWEAATLLQTCVDQTGKSDLKVLEAAASAWSNVGLDDKALALIDDALALCRSQRGSLDQVKPLLILRQQYSDHLAGKPSATAPATAPVVTSGPP